MKKMLKWILGIAVVLIICFAGVVLAMRLLFGSSLTGDDGVQAGYSERISATGQLEQKYFRNGQYEVAQLSESSKTANIGKYSIYYPKNNQEPSRNFPLIVMVNGTKTPASTYGPILEHLASWGFVVIGNEDLQSGKGDSTSATLEHALALNNSEASPLYRLVNTEKIGIMGHSQGGAGAINAITNFENGRHYTSLYTASTATHSTAQANGWNYDTSRLAIPYFMMAGTGNQDNYITSPLSEMKKDYDGITDNTPAVLGRRKQADHKDVLEYGDGYMTAWFLWTLHNDAEAGSVFTGDNPELRRNDSWQDVQSKFLPGRSF